MSALRSMSVPRVLFLVALVLAVAGLSVIPQPYNIKPFGALMLFAGATLLNLRLAIVVPLFGLFLTELAFYRDPKTETLWIAIALLTYLSHIANVFIGRWVISSRTPNRIICGTLLGAAQFFVVTNFISWAAYSQYYARSVTGLFHSYVAALPFLQNSLIGDFFYVTVLFGTLRLAELVFPQLCEQPRVETAAPVNA